jgi:hypothetical protein
VAEPKIPKRPRVVTMLCVNGEHDKCSGKMATGSTGMFVSHVVCTCQCHNAEGVDQP